MALSNNPASFARAALLVLVLALVVVDAHGGHGGGGHGSHSGGHGGGKKRHGGKKAQRRRLCSGPSCKAMSDLLPQLAFADGFGPKVQCGCADFAAGRCFAPGCFPCDGACFSGEQRGLAALPGPFGTGLLCSSGCLPCCQAPDDDDLYEFSTCELPEGGCY